MAVKRLGSLRFRSQSQWDIYGRRARLLGRTAAPAAAAAAALHAQSVAEPAG